MPLVVLEGIDASGKATQIQKLHDWAAARFGSEAVGKHDFPHYSSPTGRLILQLLKNDWALGARPGAEVDLAFTRALVLQSLMTTNRLEFVQMLRSFQVPNRFGFLDRYYGSGFVYGEADGLDFEYLLKIHWTLPAPDLWILVDIPPEESVRRRPERRDEYETRAGFMEKVRAGYLRLFKERSKDLPGKWTVVDGTASVDDVHKNILAAIQDAGLIPSSR